MAIRVKVSAENRIFLPLEVRKRLRIRAGDHLLVDIRDGYIILMAEPPDYSRHLTGLHRAVWEGIDAQEYVKQERDAWKE